MNHKRNYVIGAAVTGAIATIAASSYFIHKKIEFDKAEKEFNRKNVPFIFKRKNKSVKNVIPLNLFTAWHTKDLPPLMKQNYDQLKKDNPEFNHFLYDEAECREFIKNNYDSDVLYAFDKLIPIAYKVDLWRCCILYKLGGVYLDIKFKCINGFKFIALTDKEYFVRDRWNMGIYNALLVCKAGNQLLLNLINHIVKNTQTNFYGQNALHPTGPYLFKEIVDQAIIDNFELVHEDYNGGITYIVFNDVLILKRYPEYRDEQKKNQKTLHYDTLWHKRQIYYSDYDITFNRKNMPFQLKHNYDSVIPLNLFVTWHTKDLPPLMKQNYDQLKNDNPEFNHFLYDEAECREFIKTNFEHDVLYAFDKLIPLAYKADLWRYCVLYKLGGVYLDIKIKCINGFKLIALTDKEYFVRDRIASGSGIYNAIMICKTGNPILLQVINQIVKNVQTNFYGETIWCPTGPHVFKRFMNNRTIDSLELYNDDLTSRLDKTYVAFGDTYILTHYDGYYAERKNPYYFLWNKRKIYKTL